MVEIVERDGVLLSIIVRSSFDRPGVHFLTPGDQALQLAYMRHPRGKSIEPHSHRTIPREVHATQEVLVLKRGRIRVDFFAASHEYLESRVLEAGDAIFLASGGHGFEVLEDVEMFEVKQGPFAGDREKVRFQPPEHKPHIP